MLITNLYPSIIQTSFKSPASRIKGMLVKTQMVCLNAPKEKEINCSLRANTVHVLTYFHGHRQFLFKGDEKVSGIPPQK